jgi:hypothetical protein
MRSTIDENIFVIGDACIAGDMPKSGFSANSQAKVAAMNIRGDLVGSKVFPAKYANTCWSLIETDDAMKVGAQYAPRTARSPRPRASSARPRRMRYPQGQLRGVRRLVCGHYRRHVRLIHSSSCKMTGSG